MGGIEGKVVNLEFFIGLLGLVLVLLLVLGVYILVTYNKLVALRNAATTASSQIATELQQRLDLIPALVTTVKGYAAHERETLEAVTKARTAAVNMRGRGGPAEIEDPLTTALGRLMLLAEAYPNLKADSNFLDLQNQLSAVERRINLARRFYNESVLVYNTAQQQFPANLVAKPLGIETSVSYSAKPEAEEPPKFSF